MSINRKLIENRDVTADDMHGLPKPKFSDRERSAYDWLMNRGIRPWTVDLLTKECRSPAKLWPNVIEYAKHHGWEG